MAKEFLNRSGVMLLQAVIGLSCIDVQKILSTHGKRNRLSFHHARQKPHCRMHPFSTHFPERSWKSARFARSLRLLRGRFPKKGIESLSHFNPFLDPRKCARPPFRLFLSHTVCREARRQNPP